MTYTNRDSEVRIPLATLYPASQTVEQNTSRVLAEGYHRFFIEIIVGAMSSNATLDADLEQHDAASGGTTKNVTGKSITQLTDAGSDDNSRVGIELRTEELDVNNGFKWISLEVTPATAAVILTATIYGIEPRYAPVGTSVWDEVVD
jgi:hypothetical protein